MANWQEAARELKRAAAELQPDVLPRERMGMSTREVIIGALAMRTRPSAAPEARSVGGRAGQGPWLIEDLQRMRVMPGTASKARSKLRTRPTSWPCMTAM